MPSGHKAAQRRAGWIAMRKAAPRRRVIPSTQPSSPLGGHPHQHTPHSPHGTTSQKRINAAKNIVPPIPITHAEMRSLREDHHHLNPRMSSAPGMRRLGEGHHLPEPHTSSTVGMMPWMAGHHPHSPSTSSVLQAGMSRWTLDHHPPGRPTVSTSPPAGTRRRRKGHHHPPVTLTGSGKVTLGHR